MATGGEVIGFIVAAAGIAALHGWFSDKSKKLKEDEFNRTLRQQLTEEKRQLEQKAAEIAHDLQKQTEHLAALRREFEAGYLRGRKWLAQFIGDADKVFDDSLSSTSRSKKRPALKAAEEVSAARLEKR